MQYLTISTAATRLESLAFLDNPWVHRPLTAILTLLILSRLRDPVRTVTSQIRNWLAVSTNWLTTAKMDRGPHWLQLALAIGRGPFGTLGPDLRHAQEITDITQAKEVADASVRAANLRSDQVSQEMLNNLLGDTATQLPDGLSMPDHWDDETIESWEPDPKFEAWLKQRRASRTS